MSDPLDYIRDPAEIYRQSFATVRREADLARFSGPDTEVAVRLIHACGQVEIAENLIFSRDATESGVAALMSGKPVLCDAEMVAAGIIRQRLPAGVSVVCALNDPQTPSRAEEIGNTRSAAAVEFWRDHIEGAIVAIGNAPTALFHLLELLDAGWPKPALIIGLPVGFVGAAESKAELIADAREVPYITLVGRMGGSAMASAAINAIAGQCGTLQ